ncbi:Secreted protease with a PDZ domain [Propionibacterium freudenreichii subsp. freudenreichii]|jgi:PDZ domain-containing protein|uniref:Secreted protease with a PDZ domain n=1 Tax=Propionibacterium freudenreichii subsp. freudenreichii TaxID=66712 RepID=A0A0B7NZJ9_PROFF|nr:PDZ domain-containing protein [Propionibacterium freudenreichii]CEP26849.1 Secreted protease with a PDZ domain [Propionibacterium freudenreichii subsp. freudenreichii]MCT2995412.1 PDZ domain-containing protein [Propionibacterium freudenreichii]MDK9645799.1 PDZ domain-containing protein [Propionibacterium freudenreichii]MDK9656285.1 PDZ domain-containing protein [Propionibacterium freudenreichii]MDK9665788.1 PDZ domain-containing protein [Propionibacterium freudenreichii]
MTRNTRTAIVAALCFVLLAGAVTLIPIPFVAWSPGVTYNLLGAQGGEPAVQVSGAETSPTDGQLLLSTVAATKSDSHLTLPEALANYLLPFHNVMPRDWIYPVGMSASELTQQSADEMDTSQRNATVAALRAAHIPVQENAVIDSVSSGGPAYELLQAGDVIDTVNGKIVSAASDVTNIIKDVSIGDTIEFGITRNGAVMKVQVTTQASASDRSVPRVGMTLRDGYQYLPQVQFTIDPDIDQPRDGLVLALAVYELVSPTDLAQGRTIAATGTIDPSGTVGATSGVEEKLRSAERGGATVFLVPAGNCSETQQVKTSLDLVKVNKLDDAITSLESLARGDMNGVPRC